MEKALYKEFYETEHRHWWFRSRREIVAAIFAKHCLERPNPRVLDVGTGTGHVMLRLREYTDRLEGLDSSPDAIAFARGRGVHEPIALGEFPGLKIGKRFDVITFLDVLEHIEDDSAALREIHDLLEPGGRALVTVPAHAFLWSGYDVYTHHKRRYSKKDLRKLILASGFEIEFESFYNAFFFVPFVVFRKLRGLLGRKEAFSDVFLPPAPLNWIFERIFGLERFILPRFSLPFGVSIVMVAKRPLADLPADDGLQHAAAGQVGQQENA